MVRISYSFSIGFCYRIRLVSEGFMIQYSLRTILRLKSVCSAVSDVPFVSLEIM